MLNKKIYYYLEKIRDALETGWAAPVTCEIDPSNHCMLNCKFCMYADYLKATREHLDFALYLDLIEELYDLGVKSVTFTGGGEPLMNPRFNGMVSSAQLYGLEVGLITNGVLLKQVRHPESFAFIRVSLDASSRRMYRELKGKDKFETVLNNIIWARKEKAFVGISYVVCEQNKDGLKDMVKLGKELGVAYVQFKPAWSNGEKFTDYEVPDGNNIIATNRYMAEDQLPCDIAGLIGVVGADANAYFCCQYRGNERYCLGSLKDHSFVRLWKKRTEIEPDISKCPHCRYMNYARAYNDTMKGDTLFLEHKNFL